MSKQDTNNFNFWCPVEISKAIDETTGEEIMLLGGIASTADEDSDGEFLDPNGFDIKPLLNSGMVNWHHQAKTCPATIVGEPVKAEIRKDGLYIETQLYPSSPVAREIWSLAQTLDRDSKTRRLGYSIEGKVLERKSNDKSSPDYKKISKAIITGVAITHQPKNPKTFANIIKGEIDDDFDDEDEDVDKKKKRKETKEEREYYQGVGIEEKSLDTTAARPLIKEEVDPKLKVVTFGKAEVMERLFQDIPGISIEKAKKVYNLIKNISIMAKRVGVTEDDITKAYDALGLDMPQQDIMKGDDSDDEDYSDDEEEETDEDEDTEDNVKKAKNKPAVDDDTDESEEEPDDEEDDEEEDDDEEDEEPVVKKAVVFNRLERIEKAVATSHLQNARYIKALGVIVKDQSNQLNKAVDALNIAGNKIDELTSINKAQNDEIELLKAQIEELGNATPAPKSVRNVAAVERNFNKGNDNDFGAPVNNNQVSVLNKAAISDILDQATFAKGYDAEYSNALMGYESNGQVAANIRQRIKSEFGIEII
jgi:hypothetical protein